jgi:cytochrome c553
MERFHRSVTFLFPAVWLLAAASSQAADPTPEQEKFFEEKVRPVLVANCYKCHSDKAQKGDLRLDSAEAAMAGGESGAVIVPGKPEESLLVEAINYESLEMPPDGKLSAEAVAALTEWVRLGAPWPGGHSSGVGGPALRKGKDKLTDEDRAWWAFQPVKELPPPDFAGDTWSRTPIDRFLLARAEWQAGSLPYEADKRTLIRRVYFDLAGLPPTAEEVDAFLADDCPDAFERLVDRLLASPQFGERWARHWLDLVRYAESDGYKADAYRPHAWRYRDYVIRSLNADKPYDRFMAEQIAGDEIAPHDPDALVATGYYRIGIYEYNQRDVRTQWSVILNDITDVTADVFLGMGMSCARCHDHKFDPLLQKDYYRLQAFIAPIIQRDDLPAATPSRLPTTNGGLPTGRRRRPTSAASWTSWNDSRSKTPPRHSSPSSRTISSRTLPRPKASGSRWRSSSAGWHRGRFWKRGARSISRRS